MKDRLAPNQNGITDLQMKLIIKKVKDILTKIKLYAITVVLQIITQ